MDTQKKKLSGIYGITSDAFLAQPINKICYAIEQSCHAGLSILQYRQKSTPRLPLQALLKIKTICKQNNVLFIINDNMELALSIGADGVHLGKDDGVIQYARNQAGNRPFIIGASCYNSLSLAKEAEASGASYVAFGAMFPSASKPEAPLASIDTLIKAKQELSVPICCIGGIDSQNLKPLKASGCDMFAVISAIFDQDNTYKATRKLVKSISCD